MSGKVAPYIDTTNLLVYFDPGNPQSYTSGSSICYNLIRDNTFKGTLNGVTFNTGSKGIFNMSGVSTYIDFSTHYYPAYTWKGTAMAWFKTSNSATGSAALFLKNPIFAQSEDSAMSGLGVEGGYLSICYYNYMGATWTKVSSSINVSDNNWHHVAFITDTTTYGITNSGSWSVYLDGQPLIYSQSLHGFASNWLDRIGIDRYGGCFTGSLGAIQIYQRELTEAEIIKSYKVLKSRYQ